MNITIKGDRKLPKVPSKTIANSLKNTTASFGEQMGELRHFKNPPNVFEDDLYEKVK
jgi:hypothetical protein